MAIMNIPYLRRLMNSLRYTHLVTRLAATRAHKAKEYKLWSHYMRQCKEYKRKLAIVTHWLHTLMYANGMTLVRQPVRKDITARDLLRVARSNWLRQAD